MSEGEGKRGQRRVLLWNEGVGARIEAGTRLDICVDMGLLKYPECAHVHKYYCSPDCDTRNRKQTVGDMQLSRCSSAPHRNHSDF